LPAPAKKMLRLRIPITGEIQNPASFDCICSQRELAKRTVS
jgi:hypothetical protein